jgi:hypothetical protein
MNIGLPSLEGTDLSSLNVQLARSVNQRLRRAANHIARHGTICLFHRMTAREGRSTDLFNGPLSIPDGLNGPF